MILLDQKTVEVKSFAFGKETLYLENHLNMPHYSQSRGIKDSFRLSDGNQLDLRVLFVPDVVAEMNGQRTRMKIEEELLLEYSTGHVACCANVYCFNFEKLRNPKLMIFKDVLFTSHTESYNIHHFMLEVLPVLWLQREILRGKSLVIIGSQDSSFAEEIINLLDLDIKVIVVPIGSVCHFKDSIFLETLPFRVYPTQILEEIRIYIWEKLSLEKKVWKARPEVLFLGRGDRSRNRRQIVNEHLLLQYLGGKFGSVKTIRPGLTDLIDTINSIANAKVVAGPTGGALINLIWARNMSDFIEVIPNTYPGDTESKELSRIFAFTHQSIYSRNTNASVNFSSSDQEVILP